MIPSSKEWVGKGAPEFIIFHPLVCPSLGRSAICERAPGDSDPQSSLEMLQKKLRNNSRARLGLSCPQRTLWQGGPKAASGRQVYGIQTLQEGRPTKQLRCGI